MALGLTLLAGLSTGIGSLIGLGSRPSSHRFLTLALGFSAGAMVYVSLVEILPKARLVLVPLLGARLGYAAAVLGFFVGIVSMALIDRWLPVHDASGALQQLAPGSDGRQRGPSVLNSSDPTERRRLLRMGLFAALAIGIHNIPEGLAVSAPVYFATGSRRLAFWVSFLSGLAEPIGGLVGYVLFRSLPNPIAFGLVFAGLAGVMVYVSLDELLPAARDYGDQHLTILSLMSGMAVMAISLVLLA